MATKVVSDLVTKFSFAGPLAPLAKYNTMLGSAIGTLGLWTAAIAGGVAIFQRWADGVLHGVDALDALAYQTRLSVAEIQEWNFVAEQNQSTAQAMQSTLLNLGNAIGSAAQYGSEDFARLGINIRSANGHIKTSSQVLEEVRGRFRALGLSLEVQRSFASALGIDPSLLRMLNQSSAELAELRERAEQFGTLTDAQAKQAANYTKSVKALSFGLDSLRNLIAVGVAPQMERMVDGFGKLLRDNKDWVVNGIQVAFKWLGHLWDMFGRIGPLLLPIAAGFLAIKVALLGISGVPIVLLLGGIALALDDLVVAFRGGRSVIADFFEQEFGIDVVKELTAAFEGLSEAVDTAFGWLKDFFGWLNRKGAETGESLFHLGLPEGLEAIKDLGKEIGKRVPSVVEGLGDAARATGERAPSVVESLGGAGQVVGDWFRSFMGEPSPVEPPVVVPPEVVAQPPVVVPPEVVAQPPIVVPPEVVAQPPIVVPPEVVAQPPVVVPFGTAAQPPAPPLPTTGLTPDLSGLTDTLNSAGRELDSGFSEMINWFRLYAGATPTGAQGARTIEQNNTFNVYTSDPTAAARATLDGMSRQLDNANTQLNVGGL